MYDEFFKLHTLPFENTPDPRFFFASEQHREAMAAIEYTIRMRKGFVLITGEIGAGKTTVSRTICQRLADAAQIVPVHHGHRDGEGLLRQVLRAMELKVEPGDGRAEMLDRLRAHLLGRVDTARPVVLFADEAQTLSDEALEELRLLSNFDTSTQKPVQVALVGQPELRARLGTPAMTALRQRLAMARHLRRLNRDDTAQYIRHRLAAASEDPQSIAVSFGDDAIDAIYAFSKGVPRVINSVCDNALLVGYVRQVKQINADMVRTVLVDMVPVITADRDLEPTGRRDTLRDAPALTLTGT